MPGNFQGQGGFIYAGSTLFGFGANTFLRSIGEYVSAENNTSQSDFSLSLEGRGIQGEGEIPQQKKSYWDCVERAAAESFQTSLFTLTGMGSALGLKAFFGKNKNFAEKAVGLLGNKAPLIFQEVGVNLSTTLLQIGSQIFSGQPLTTSTLLNTGMMMFSGLGGAYRELGLGKGFLSMAGEALHRVGETWVQNKLEGKEMNWVQAIGSLEGATQRMMGGTLRLAGLSHRPDEIHPGVIQAGRRARQAGKATAVAIGGAMGLGVGVVSREGDFSHDVFTSMGATRMRQRWSDIPYENLSDTGWVEKIGEHLLKNGLKENGKVQVGVDFLMKPEGVQPCSVHIPPKETLAAFHTQVTLDFEIKEKEVVVAIASINHGGKGDLPRLRSGLLGNRLLGKSTKENYPQVWYDCVEGRVDFLFHGKVVDGLGLGLNRKKANWDHENYTMGQFEASWNGKDVHQLFKSEPWVSNLKSGESVEIFLTGLAMGDTLKPQGCCVVGASSLVPQSPTIYKVKIKLTRTEKGYEIEGMEKDCSGNNASDVARMMGLNRSPIMPCADLFRLDKNEIPLDDWYEIIGNCGTGKERLNQLRETLVGDERYKKGFVLRGYVEEGRVKNPLCQPLDLGSNTSKGITSIRFEFQGDGVVITGIDGVPKLLKHHHLVMGGHRIAPHFIPEAIDDAMMVEWRGVGALSSRGFTPLSQRELVALLHDDSLDWAWEKVRTQRKVPPFKAFLVIADENSSFRIKIVRGDAPPVIPDSWVIPAMFGEKEVIIGEIPPVFSVAPHERIPMVIRVRSNAKLQLGLVLRTPTMAGLEALCSSHGKDFISQWYKTTFEQHPKDGEVVSIYGNGHNYTNWREGKIPGGSLMLGRDLRGASFPFYVPVFHAAFKNEEWAMMPGKSWSGAQVKRYIDLLLQHGCMKPCALYSGATSQKLGDSGKPTFPPPLIANMVLRPVPGQAVLHFRHSIWAGSFSGDKTCVARMAVLERNLSGLTSPLGRHLMNEDLDKAYQGRFGISARLVGLLEEKAVVYAYFDQLKAGGIDVDDDVLRRALSEATDRRNRGSQNSLLEMVHEYLVKLK